SSFDIKSKFSDSLVGRTINFDIFNLSFNEFLRFKKVNYNLDKLSDIHLEKVIKLYKEYVLYGGYPQIVLENSIDKKERYLQQIIDTYVKKDIRDLANIKDIRKFNNVLKILAQQTGNLLNVNTLSASCGISKETIENYLFILENTYIIKLVPPFSTNAKIEVIKAPKIFFYDTGLLQLLWLKTLQKTILGNVFETSIFSELVKKYGFENINYWRTKNQEEIDFILIKKDKIIPIEVKMGFNLSKKSPIQLFINKYNSQEYKIVGLNKIIEVKNFIYPWDL
ncbi:MAG: ATP-binding protein, partial [Patescibacteria group bacterium]